MQAMVLTRAGLGRVEDVDIAKPSPGANDTTAAQKTISVHLGLYTYSRSIPPIACFPCCLTMVAPAFFHP